MKHDLVVGGVAPGKWNSKMQRIDAGYVYELGDIVRCLRPLQYRPEVQAYEIWAPLTKARQTVEGFLTNSVYMMCLRTVYPSANAFLAAADALLLRIVSESMSKVTSGEMLAVMEAFDRFEPVLGSELSSLSMYLVQPKGAYDVSILVEAGERMFPGSLVTKVPEAVVDAQEGSKALAFELWTAAAFHFHRANESVLRRYFDQTAGKEKRPKTLTMGTMLGTLKQLKLGDPRIIVALENIKEFHRNPIAHPGQKIESVEQCLDLVAALRAAMGYMLELLPMEFTPPAAGQPGLLSQLSGPFGHLLKPDDPLNEDSGLPSE